MHLKKYVAGLLVFTLLLPLCGCRKKSDVSIDDLEEGIQDLYDDVEFSKREKNHGYSFSCDREGFTDTFSISGTADSGEKLLTVELEFEEVDVDFMNDLTLGDLTYYSSHMGDLTRKEFNVLGFILTSSLTADLLRDDNDSLEMILDWIDDTETDNGWKISITTDESDETATFVATFVGE